jgi:hypothetical protein
MRLEKQLPNGTQGNHVRSGIGTKDSQEQNTRKALSALESHHQTQQAAAGLEYLQHGRADHHERQVSSASWMHLLVDFHRILPRGLVLLGIARRIHWDGDSCIASQTQILWIVAVPVFLSFD